MAVYSGTRPRRDIQIRNRAFPADASTPAAAGRHGYDPGFPDARPWLYGFATNLIARHKRDEARRYRYLQAAGPAPDLPDFAERVLATVTARSMRARLAGALARLSPGDRDVLLLIAWEQLSYEEVARARHPGWHGAVSAAPGQDPTSRASRRHLPGADHR